MATSIDAFNYDLPPERIAQEPVSPRDHSRLMVLDRKSGAWEHTQFFEIGKELKAGDVLVMNDTKVFKARLRGKARGNDIEVFLLRAHTDGWEALLKPGRRVRPGERIDLGGLWATVKEKNEEGVATLAIEATTDGVLAFTDAHGEIPVPPYVEKIPEKFDSYQTVYARETGSVAAPTAGFHFTERLMNELKEKGVQFEFVTLHVGLGTFRPVKTKTLEEHQMHSEFVRIDPVTARRINAAKQEGRRVIAVGTTTVRALEGSGVPEDGFTGDVNMFITPGYKFTVIDALITNFHLPKSTLLVLVSAFAGRDHVLAAYEEAIKENYRFYSFGDAMFIR